MTAFRKALTYFVIFLMVFNTISCDMNDAFGANQPTSLNLSKTELVYNSFSAVNGELVTITGSAGLKSGNTDSSVLRYTFPEDTSFYKIVSPDSSGRTVQPSDGKVSFNILKAGQWTIKVEAMYKGAAVLSTNIIVNVKGFITGLQIKDAATDTVVTDTITKNINETFKLAPVFTPSSTSQTDVSWSVDRDELLTINESTGEVKVKDQPGEAVITVTSRSNPSISASVTLKIKDNTPSTETPATTITVTPQQTEISINSQSKTVITASVRDGLGQVVDDGNVEWESDNTEVVTVTPVSGDNRRAEVTPVGGGTATVTAKFTDEGNVATAPARITVTGAITGISLIPTKITLPAEYDMTAQDVRVDYQPSTTVQKGFEILSYDSNYLQPINGTGAGDGYLAFRTIKVTEANTPTVVEIASTANPDFKSSVSITIKKTVEDADRIQQIELSESSYAFNPPFTSTTSHSITANTRIYNDNGTYSNGEYSKYGLTAKSSDETIVTIRQTENTIEMYPHKPGTATITVTSALNPEISATCTVTVNGALESFNPEFSSVEVIEGATATVTINPYPIQALVTASIDETDSRTLITTSVDGNTIVSVAEKDGGSFIRNNNNTFTLTVKGLMPGKAKVNFTADGKNILSLPVTVTAKSNTYVKSISLDQNAIVMKQDSDGEYLRATLIDQDGNSAETIDGQNIVWSITENGTKYTENQFGSLKSVKVTKSSNNVLYFEPGQAGVVIVDATIDGNNNVQSSCRVEVGGAAVAGDDLKELRLNQNHYNVRRGYSINAEVTFVPSTYENQNVEWRYNGSELTIRANGTRATITGNTVGKYTATVVAHNLAGDEIEAPFTVEVKESGPVYNVTLDKTYLSYDRNQKALQVITATVNKDGVNQTSGSDSQVEWKLTGAEVISINEDARGRSVSISLKADDSTGVAYVTATSKQDPTASATAYIEVIDSTVTNNTLRSISLGSSSMQLETGNTATINTIFVPENAAVDWTRLQITSANTGIVRVGRISSADKLFDITGVSAGTTTVTVYDPDTKVSARIRVTVIDNTQIPSYIQFTPNVVNLSQEYMDTTETVIAKVYDENGNEMNAASANIQLSISSASARIIRLQKDKQNPNQFTVRPRSAGIAEVTASYPGLDDQTLIITVGEEKSITSDVKVLVPSLGSIKMLPSTTRKVTITPAPTPSLASGSPVEIEWSSKNENVAVVTPDGSGSNSYTATISTTNATSGSAVITARYKGTDISTDINVAITTDNDAVNAVSVNPSYIVLDLDAKALTQIEAEIEKGFTASSTEEIKWSLEPSLQSAIGIEENLNDQNSLLNITKQASGEGFITAASATDESVYSRMYVQVVRSSEIQATLNRVVLNQTRVSLNIGGAFQIKPTTVPSAIVADTEFKYTSSSTNVATVSDDGYITAVGAGTATITVSGVYNNGTPKTAVLYLTVTDNTPTLSYIKTSPDQLNLSMTKMDQWTTVSAEVYSTSGKTNNSVEWRIDDNTRSLLNIRENSNGSLSVSPKNSGRGEIVAHFGTLTDQIIPVVVGSANTAYADIERLEPSTNGTIKLNAGKSFTLSVTPLPGAGRDVKYDWISSAESVVTVQKSSSNETMATIIAVANGTATITAKVQGDDNKTATFSVEVTDNASGISAINVAPTNIVFDLATKDLTRLTAVSFENGTEVAGSYTWTVDESLKDAVEIPAGDTATKDLVFKDTAVHGTTGYITVASAADSSIYARSYINIVDSRLEPVKLLDIALSSNGLVMNPGQTQRITVSTVPSSIQNGSASGTFTTAWVSADPTVATVNNGTITAVGNGETNITVIASFRAEDGNVSEVQKGVSVKVEETAKGSIPSYIRTSADQVTLSMKNMDQWTKLSAEVYSTSGKTNLPVTWNIDDATKTIINVRENSDGSISINPKNAGRGVIYAHYDGLTDQGIYVIVGSANTAYSDIEMLEPSTNGAIRLNPGKSFTLSVTPLPGAGSNTQYDWVSDNENVVTVEKATGNQTIATINAIELGNATITATVQGSSPAIQTSFAVTVTDDASGVSAVNVSPTNIVYDMASKDLTRISAVSYENGAETTDTYVWAIDSSLSNAVEVPTGTGAVKELVFKSTAQAGDKGFIKVSSIDDTNIFARTYINIVDSSKEAVKLLELILSSNGIKLNPGQRATISVSTIPAAIGRGNVAGASFSVKWTSNDPDVATVNNGVITATGAGTTEIVAAATYIDTNGESQTMSRQVAVTVEEPAGGQTAKRLMISPEVVSFDTASSPDATVRAILLDSDNNNLTGNYNFTWTIEDESVADITPSADTSTATITPKKDNASSKFTVNYGSITAEGMIIIGEVASDQLIALLANPSTVTMMAKESVSASIRPISENMAGKISLIATPSSNNIKVNVVNGSTADDYAVTIEALAEGSYTVRIQAQDANNQLIDGVSTTIGVTVRGTATPQRIIVTPNVLDLDNDNDTAELTARIISNSGNDYTGNVTWRSENPAIATVAEKSDNVATVAAVAVGDTNIVADFEAISASVPVTYTYTGPSLATSPYEIYPVKRTILLANMNTTDVPDSQKKATLTTGYFPVDLADQYKSIIWSKDGVSVDFGTFDDTARQITENGQIEVIATSESGATTITAISKEDSKVRTTFTAQVLPEGVVIEGGIPEITLDKASILLDVGGQRATLKATVTNDLGEVKDATILWSVTPDSQQAITLEKLGSDYSRAVVSTDKAGSVIVTAKVLAYEDTANPDNNIYVDASCSVQVSDSAAQGQELRSVSLSDKKLVMVAQQETRQLTYTVTPNVAVQETWISSDPTVATVSDKGLVTALKEGKTTITLTVQNGGAVRVQDTCEVTVTNAIPQSGKWASLKADITAMSLSPYDSQQFISYTLTNSDKTLDESTQMSAIRILGINGEVLADIKNLTDYFKPATGTAPSNVSTDYFDLYFIGGTNAFRQISVDPKSPGAAYLEVYFYDNPDKISEGGVVARTYITVSGNLKSVSTGVQYINMAVGDRDTITINANPTSAILSGGTAEWKSSNAGIITINDTTNTTASIQARAIGSTDLSYTYTDKDNVKYGPVLVKINVKNAADLAGGVKKLAFDSAYATISYPYSRQFFDATLSFFDGTTSKEGISYALYDPTGYPSTKTPSTLATVSMADNGVYITARQSGTAILEASYTDSTGETHEAIRTLEINGAVNALIPSSNRIVLYTGGSSMLSVTPDDSSAPSLNYTWRLKAEYYTQSAAAGPVVQRPSSLTSAFESVKANTEDYANVVIAATDLITDEDNPKFNRTLYESYPRRGVFEVSMPDYPNVTAEVEVIVNPLPENNTYPRNLVISSERLTLNPPFETDETMTATVTDSDGNEIDATIDWYYYPIGANWMDPADATDDSKIYKFTTWLDSTKVNTNDYIRAYIQEDGTQLYYKPLKAGEYRLKAIVRENPSLQKTATVTVRGEVESIEADSGSRLTITKDASATINASFTPDNALARNVFWILGTGKTGETAYNKNQYLSFNENGNTVSVRAIEETTTDTEQILYLEYWDTETMIQLENARKDGSLVTDLNKYSEITGKASARLIASYQVAIEVAPKAKTIQTFAITGMASSIDPEKTESAIEFTVTATATGGSSSSSSSSNVFENWSWVDVDIIGSESGFVYATSRLNGNTAEWGFLTDPTTGLPIYDADGNKDFSQKANKLPIATGGKVNRNNATYSFVLNQGGIPTEPVVLVAHLKDGYETGYVDGQTSDLSKKIFDTDTLGFNNGRYLSYIGGQVTKILPDTTTYNVNNNEQSSEGSNIDLITGASAKLTLKYTPAYTHQKGAFWYVVSGTMVIGDNENPVPFTSFSAMPGSDQCSVFGTYKTKENVILRAVSIYDPWFEEQAEKYAAEDPNWKQNFLNATTEVHTNTDPDNIYRLPNTNELSVYTDYQVTVRSPIEKAIFTAQAQTTINDTEQNYPEYGFINDQIKHPDIVSESEVWCYDTSEASGTGTGGTTVDAYFVSTDLIPEYGYTLTFTQQSGTAVGTIDASQNIDKDENAFRFIPKGKMQNASGGTTVNYGDVVVRAICQDLNFSQDFTLHYRPADLRLVKYIGEEADGSIPDNWKNVPEVDASRALVNGYGQVAEENAAVWDVAIPEKTSDPLIYGMEAVVLYEGEEFPLSIISYKNGIPSYVANGVKTIDYSQPQDPVTGEYQYVSTKYATKISIYQSNGQTPDNGEHLVVKDAKLVDGSKYQTEWFTDSKFTLKGLKQGVAYLTYTIAPLAEGQTTPGDTAGTMTGSVMVYIIDDIDQALAKAAAISSQNANASVLLPAKISVAQWDKWFLGAKGAVSESIYIDGQDQQKDMYRGRTFASFMDNDGTFNATSVGLPNGSALLTLPEIRGTVSLSSNSLNDLVDNVKGAISDIQVTGENGLKKLTNVTALKITDGAGALISSNKNSPNYIFDISDTTVKELTITSPTSVGDYTIVLPKNSTKVSITGGTIGTIDFSKVSKDTLTEVILTDMDVLQNTYLENFANLTTVNVSRASNNGEHSNPWGKNTLLSITGNTNLKVLNADYTYYGYIIAAFPMGTEARYNSTDTADNTSFSANNLGVATPCLKGIAVSGGIKTFTIGYNSSLSTVVHTSNLRKDSINDNINNYTTKGSIAGGNWIKNLINNSCNNINTLLLDTINQFTDSGNTKSTSRLEVKTVLKSFNYTNASSLSTLKIGQIVSGATMTLDGGASSKAFSVDRVEGTFNADDFGGNFGSFSINSLSGTANIRRSTTSSFTVNEMTGSINVTGSSSLKKFSINEYRNAAAGTATADQTGLETLDNVNAAVTTLSVQSCANLKDININTQNTPRNYIEVLNADNSGVTSINIHGASHLTSLNADNNKLTSMDIQGSSLETLSVMNNSSLGANSWTIGNFNYTATQNSVTTNGQNAETPESFYKGHKITNGTTVDWETWLTPLKTLKMSGSGIRFFIEQSSTNSEIKWSIKIRFGKELPSGRIGRFKKNKGMGFNARKSASSVTFSDKTIINYDIEDDFASNITWDNSSVIGRSILMDWGDVKTNEALKEQLDLPSNLITIAIYSENTSTFKHDFNFSVFPFGE